MNIQELLAGKPSCSCGKSHVCPIDAVVIGEGACNALAELTTGYGHILLVADENTYAVGGETVKAQLGDRLADTLIYSGKTVLVPNEEALEQMQSKVTDQTDLIIGIGSGVINDLCKQVSFQNKLRYYIVATAPSMDGYASKGSALILGGMKVTLNADVPKAIIGDVNLLRTAPFDMIQAGYGDIIGKYSCLNDWKLSALVNGEYLCREVMDATYEEVEKTVRLADGLVARESEAICALMEALVAVGILMAYVGNSRPASGSEHHLSHYFEIVGILRGEEYLPHGVDVCYSAIETELLREKLLTIDNLDGAADTFNKEEYEANIRRVYGSVADEVFALQNKMGWYEQKEQRMAVYRAKWPQIKALLADAPSSARMNELTEKIGLSYDKYVALYGQKKLEDAHLYAKDLKDRYSVLWLYYDLMTK
ncbi:MAG: sn-glycerol-1-phosphate dehydrogenase [Clostridia bacterium]|nr:sn-glycerol-1-phosphate dehydrogenase [Clostridia bacterium]